MMMMFVLH